MKELIESKWEEILSLLETEYDISSIMINTWIRSLKIYEVKNNTVYFYVDEKLGENALKFLKRKEFDIFLLSSIRETLNDSTIDIVIDEKKNLIESDEEARKESVQKSDSYKEAVSRSNLNPKYTFDTGIPMTIQWYLDNKEWWENIISGEYQNYFEKMYVEKGRAKE